jgi:hypothetical protein
LWMRMLLLVIFVSDVILCLVALASGCWLSGIDSVLHSDASGKKIRYPLRDD